MALFPEANMRNYTRTHSHTHANKQSKCLGDSAKQEQSCNQKRNSITNEILRGYFCKLYDALVIRLRTYINTKLAEKVTQRQWMNKYTKVVLCAKIVINVVPVSASIDIVPVRQQTIATDKCLQLGRCRLAAMTGFGQTEAEIETRFHRAHCSANLCLLHIVVVIYFNRVARWCKTRKRETSAGIVMSFLSGLSALNSGLAIF